MNEQIFRSKSLDKIKSPENLDDYIRVANPGVWLILVSVIVLLAGACVWGVFGHVDSTVPCTVYVENGRAVCFVAGENADSVQDGLTVKFADTLAVITQTEEDEGAGVSCLLSPEVSAADGSYEGSVVVKTYTPVSFILN